ncbi:polycystin-1-like protein 1 [Ascaphus truei]|uniref:polycystin-1-like protein 1 n=1 Tax=Ascaphus truei TaxID=8439 RepID=UPI003F59A13F
MITTGQRFPVLPKFKTGLFYPIMTCTLQLLTLFYFSCVLTHPASSKKFMEDHWYVGCYNLSSLDLEDIGYEAAPVGMTDLPTCSKFCLRKRYPEPVCLLYGDGEGKWAVYQSDGPYINNVSSSLVTNRVETQKAFILKVSGYLASSLKKTLGVHTLLMEDVSTIQMTINWTAHNNTHYVASVQLNGYFPAYFSCIYMDFVNHSIAGVYTISVIAFNEFFNATDELGPYYIQIAPHGLSLVMNSSIVHRDEVILFYACLSMGNGVSYTWDMGDQTTYINKGPVITYKFSTVASYNITVTAWNKVGSQKAWKVVSVLHRMQPVYIFTNGTVFSTGTDIPFIAMTAENDPLYFIWHFGDRSSERTTYRSISKRYSVPNRYNIVVNATNRISSFTSDIHTIFVQRRVIPNRLVARSSVLVNSNVTFECRINSGTNVSYLWSFGDGTVKLGKNIDAYMYTRQGEFTVNVSIFNNVSTVSLTKQIFVVKEPCQPPPVKHMGPQKIQVRRYQHLHLGVTFEAAILCNISQGLRYFWSFVKSNGNLLALPSHIDNTKQTITLPRFFLDYENYTAVARVQIVGNVVYSNYTVPIEVPPSDPVSVITEGTHLFIDTKTVKDFTLNGMASFDPDNPDAHLRFHWRCAPASTQMHSCFNSTVPRPLQSYAAVITFPTAVLDVNFDQFIFTLTVSSGDRNSSDVQVFLSIISNSNLRSVQLTCFECNGSAFNWDERFSVQAVCTDCNETDDISFSWNLYWINATEINSIEVPFCRALETMGSSSLFGAILPSIGASTETSTMQITNKSSVELQATPIPTQKEFTGQYPFETSLSPALASDENMYVKETPASSFFSIEASESSFTETNAHSISRIVSQEIDQLNNSTTMSTFDLDMLDLPYPLPGMLEEGPSRGKPARARRSAIGTKLKNTSPDASEAHGSTNWTSSGYMTGNGEGWIDILNHTVNRTFPDFEAHYSGIQEGRGGSGERTEGEISGNVGRNPSEETVSDFEGGDNLLSPLANAPAVAVMVDWSKLHISNSMFSSYTVTEIGNFGGEGGEGVGFGFTLARSIPLELMDMERDINAQFQEANAALQKSILQALHEYYTLKKIVSLTE